MRSINLGETPLLGRSQSPDAGRALVTVATRLLALAGDPLTHWRTPAGRVEAERCAREMLSQAARTPAER
jgi:hypothetical protein